MTTRRGSGGVHRICWQHSVGLCGCVCVCVVCICTRTSLGLCVRVCLGGKEAEWVFVCPSCRGSPHGSEWEKLSASTIALSRTQTRRARVNSEKKYSSPVSQSEVCPWGQRLQRSSCSTCINTKTQWGQPPHTAGDIRKHRVWAEWSGRRATIGCYCGKADAPSKKGGRCHLTSRGLRETEVARRHIIPVTAHVEPQGTALLRLMGKL